MTEDKTKILMKGSARKHTFSNGGHIHKFSVKMSQANKIFDYFNKLRKERDMKETEYINFELREKREADDWGNTHMLFADIWLPETKKVEESIPDENPGPDVEEKPTDDLPF